jgi:hypothetical protein
MNFRKYAMIGASMACLAAGASAQPVVHSAPNHWGYDFPRDYDAEIAAADVHEVHYKDAHVMLMEVSNPPGYQMKMHGHPYPSVFARDSLNPPAGADLTGTARFLEPGSNRNGQNWAEGPPAKGGQFPACTSADPQAPHMPANGGSWPLHFYRMEFIFADQENLAAAKTRYANYPARKELYENDAIKFVEWTIRPGQAVPKEPLPSVLAFDSIPAFEAVSGAIGDGAGRSAAPKGMIFPRCITSGPNPVFPKATAATGPIHFYAITFKRVDGTGLKDNWQKWYPNMVAMQKGPLRP